MPFRVLMIGWEFPPYVSGGLGVACKGIVEELSKLGEEIILVLPKVGPEDRKIERGVLELDNGSKISVIYVPTLLIPYPENGRYGVGNELVDKVKLYSRMVAIVVRDISFDLIHVHDWLTIPAGIMVKNITGKPLIVHVHSTEYDRTAGGYPNYDVENIEKEGFVFADKIIAVSAYTKSVLTDHYGVDNKKIDIVHNGAEQNTFSGDSDIKLLENRSVVIFVGRLTIQKGPEYFLELAKKILSKQPNTVFVFGGDGDMYKHLVMNSAGFGLTGSVLFAGFLDPQTRDIVYKRADVFVMPSVSEPFGIVALEAANAGIPVIVSKTSGVAEILPSAIKVDFWDTDLMSGEVLKLLNDKEYQKDIGNMVQREAGLATWQLNATKITEIYKKMIKDNG